MSQSTARPKGRPLSPHLSIWKWGPHMLVSILHRMCGVALATLGTAIFVWWLAALAGGPESYASFHYWVAKETDGSALGLLANILAKITAIGLTWALFQHLANGVRHFVLDIGFSIVATLAVWAYVLTKGATS
jgi:succinate dehydrogenase / fumarate reductase, cytochrome b subunit